MWILTVLLLIAAIYFAYKANETYKHYSKQVILTGEYIRIIFLLMESNKNNDEELKKQLWRSFLFDSNSLSIDEFDKKWEAICEACGIPATKDKFGVSSDVVNRISSILNSNKDIFEKITNNYSNNLSLKDLQGLEKQTT